MPASVGCGTAVVITDGSEVLMIERGGAHGAGTWSVPGGWVDKGEDPCEAAVREVREEVVYLLHRMGFGYRDGEWRDNAGRVLRVR